MTRSFRLYSYCIGTAFALALALSLVEHGISSSALYKLAPLLGLAIAGEELVVRQRQRSGTPVLSFSAPAHIAAAIVAGPLGAAAVAALGVVVCDGLRQEGRRYLLLNASMFGLATWVGALAYGAAGGTADQIGLATLPALVALILARYFASSLILSVGTAVAGSGSLFFVVKETLWEESGAGIGEGALGVLIGLGFLGQWILFPFLAPLLAALYRSKSTLQQLRDETREALDAVAKVVDERHPSTAAHTERVAEYVSRFVAAIELPLRESERLVLAARFHDLGKIAVDAATLSKEERLSDAEIRAIRRHPRLSAHLLSPFHFAREIAHYVELHHERYDGRGYYAVATKELPIEAHVLIVADSFDAMTSARAYRPALTTGEAADELRDKAGTQFHPLVARAFAALVCDAPLASALAQDEVASLRAQFTRCRKIELPDRRVVLDPRMATICSTILSLILFGLHPLPIGVPAGFAAVALLASAAWVVRVTGARRRTRRALAVIEAGGSAATALAATGINGSAAWLSLNPGSEAYEQQLGSDIASQDLLEACAWALRREQAVEAELSSGRYLLLSQAAGGPRLALVLARQPRGPEHALLATIADRVEHPAVSRAGLRAVDSDRPRAVEPKAVFDVELDVYDRVRLRSGQLLAERVVVEAAGRMRALLRESDEIVQVGDDRFSLLFFAGDQERLETVAERLRATLAEVETPGRLTLRPRIRQSAADIGNTRPEAQARAAEGERRAAGGH